MQGNAEDRNKKKSSAKVGGFFLQRYRQENFSVERIKLTKILWSDKMIEEFKDRLRKLIHQAEHNFGGSSAATVKIVDLVLDFAIKIRATDLHIEPFENSLRFRYRIDGHLQEFHENVPMKLADFIISRIKILARMDTVTAFSPLDGAIKFEGTEMRTHTDDVKLFYSKNIPF